jgi:hypothetical protein
MKKIAALLLLSTFFLGACKKEYITQEVDQAFSAIYTVRTADWGTGDGGLSYSTTLSVPEIDDIILDHGAVVVYISYNGGDAYEALPQVFDNIAYGAVHTKGSVTLDIYDVEGNQITPPGDITVKVVLVDAKPLDQ